MLEATLGIDAMAAVVAVCHPRSRTYMLRALLVLVASAPLRLSIVLCVGQYRATMTTGKKFSVG